MMRSSCARPRPPACRSRFVLLLLGAALLFITAHGAASDRFDPNPEAVFTGTDAGPWGRVERLGDHHPDIRQESFLKPTEHADPLIRSWFGEDPSPHSGKFLLHCAPGWDGKTFPQPVLLVHGAGDNANRGWIHPQDAFLPASLPQNRQGFALTLAQLGYATFAVTYAHSQGDNFYQAEHVANAIRRIRILLRRTGDPSFKVDIIAHSKGNVAARLYCSDGRKIYPNKRFLTPFRQDVDQYIAIAAPFRGIDTPFRYYLYNLNVEQQGDLNAPLAVDRMLFNGAWKNLTAKTLYTDNTPNFFPGQCQVLYNLAGEGIVPLDIVSSTPGDANLTMAALYHGGTTAFLSSRGIKKAIDMGERLIYRLEDAGLDPSIRLGVIAGKSPFITWHVPGYGYVPLPHEVVSPPGDGVIFLESSTAVGNAVKRGARLLGVETLDFNHLGVACRPQAFRIIDAWLLQR